jgi:hypothetical protein
VIRLTFRQFRTEGLVGIGLLLAFGIVLLVTGIHLVDVNNAFLSTCKAAGDCATTPNPVASVDTPLQNALPVLVAGAPALIGLFFGAPLIARELETGTYRLAWTQSITRGRWLAIKLGLVGLVATLIGGLVTWMADWWEHPITAINQNQFGLANFGLHGVAPLGYAAFAFALGASVGAVLRRTVAAMAVTLIGFAGARLAFTYWIRSHLASPVHESISLTSPTATPGFGIQQPGGLVSLNAPSVGIPNGWVYSTSIVNKAGAAPTSQELTRACPALVRNLKAGPLGPPSQATVTRRVRAASGFRSEFQSCMERLSATFHTAVTYQPASRFWPFQWAEMGVFLAAAIALCFFAHWWLRRQYA